ncbi:NAD(+) synthase [Silvanigrella aquatica]|nr:NAD(+) synthase [Silvanigrella aquatica]
MKIAMAQIPIISANCMKNFETMKQQIDFAIQKKMNLIIFPEMSVPGYFIGDTWEQSSFLKECEYFNQQISICSSHIDIIFGSIGIDWVKKNEDGRVRKYNSVYYASKGKFIINKKTNYPFWIKSLMPNYREFDDSRYFYDLRKLSQELSCYPKDLYEPIEIKFKNKKLQIGITVCEDGWSQDYTFNPFQQFSENFKHDFFVNLSSSPFTKGKKEKRETLFSSISKKIKTPIFYVNAVGVQNVGKTVYGFDGSSAFYSKKGETKRLGGFFNENLVTGEFHFDSQDFLCSNEDSKETDKSLKNIEEMQIAIEYIIKNCMQQWQIKKVVIGASGGIDSALSAVLFARVLGSENVFLINMPSKFNSELTKKAAYILAENLNCPYTSVSIESSIEITKQQLINLKFKNSSVIPNLTGLVLENIQARDRGGRILSAISATLGAVFSCNANKVELTVGYSTLYGDQAGFLCPLADLWKHDVYDLAQHYNENVYQKEIIPKETLEVVPSAELSENHNVLENKGDPIQYHYHDYLFRSWVEHWDRKTPEDCLQAYFDGTLDKLIGCESGLSLRLFPSAKSFIEDLERWWLCYRGMGAFKRVQAPPIVAVTRRAFGFDHREHIGNPLFTSSYINLKNKILNNNV